MRGPWSPEHPFTRFRQGEPVGRIGSSGSGGRHAHVRRAAVPRRLDLGGAGGRRRPAGRRPRPRRRRRTRPPCPPDLPGCVEPEQLHLVGPVPLTSATTRGPRCPACGPGGDRGRLGDRAPRPDPDGRRAGALPAVGPRRAAPGADGPDPGRGAEGAGRPHRRRDLGARVVRPGQQNRNVAVAQAAKAEYERFYGATRYTNQSPATPAPTSRRRPTRRSTRAAPRAGGPATTAAPTRSTPARPSRPPTTSPAGATPSSPARSSAARASTSAPARRRSTSASPRQPAPSVRRRRDRRAPRGHGLLAAGGLHAVLGAPGVRHHRAPGHLAGRVRRGGRCGVRLGCGGSSSDGALVGISAVGAAGIAAVSRRADRDHHADHPGRAGQHRRPDPAGQPGQGAEHPGHRLRLRAGGARAARPR